MGSEAPKTIVIPELVLNSSFLLSKCHYSLCFSPHTCRSEWIRSCSACASLGDNELEGQLSHCWEVQPSLPSSSFQGLFYRIGI